MLFGMEDRRIECLPADDHITLEKANHRRKKAASIGILEDTRPAVIAIGDERIGGSKIYPDDRTIGGGGRGRNVDVWSWACMAPV